MCKVCRSFGGTRYVKSDLGGFANSLISKLEGELGEWSGSEVGNSVDYIEDCGSRLKEGLLCIRGDVVEVGFPGSNKVHLKGPTGQALAHEEINDDMVSSVDLENQGRVHDEVLGKVDVVSEKPTTSSNGCSRIEKRADLRISNFPIGGVGKVDVTTESSFRVSCYEDEEGSNGAISISKERLNEFHFLWVAGKHIGASTNVSEKAIVKRLVEIQARDKRMEISNWYKVEKDPFPSFLLMRKLCPNIEKEDGLETILEVPIPEEMLTGLGTNGFNRWQNLQTLMNGQFADKSSSNNEFMVLLKLVGAPLIPLQLPSDQTQTLTRPLKDCSIEDSIAKYIVQQYVAATGGVAALNALENIYAMGQVRICESEMRQADGYDESVQSRGKSEVGGFVLWQKKPDLWCLELVVSGFKICAGSDGKIAWNQSSSQPFHANKGPPRPLRRFFQGLDPRCTANLFLDAECVGENNINNEVCFMLKLQTKQKNLQAQSTSNTEIVMHTILGYFSQRTGLLVKFEDTKLVKMKPIKGKETVFWETSIESTVEDYRYIGGINIAHGGRTVATLYRYGAAQNHKRMMEETWTIEEVDFNVVGLTMNCFLPPSDSEREHEGAEQAVGMS
ncbi:hypothetical protein VNO78_00421 [Psophocarpus tetragonolobus]|uniref:Uncharacterized protein n=1 Tax=Psophocarpus tetragonolobus TaxID=3891 RepID=A0AAN9T0F7_PSOTE